MDNWDSSPGLSPLRRLKLPLQKLCRPAIRSLHRLRVTSRQAVLRVASHPAEPASRLIWIYAIAIGAWVETLILAGILGRRVEGLDLGSVVRVLVLTSVISLVAAAVAFGVQRWLAGVWGERPSQLLILVELVITTAAGGLVVVAGAAALRMEELRTIVGVMADLVRRRGRP